ncbi:MAG: ABC transporter permease subunit [Bacilli bacterium]
MLAQNTLVYKSNDKLFPALLIAIACWCVVTVVFPFAALLSETTRSSETGEWVGLANFIEYMQSPTLQSSAVHSLTVSVYTTIIATTLALCYAFALTRANVVGRTLLYAIGISPLFMPTMMHGIGLMYLFGNQGMITRLLENFGIPTFELYGLVGIVIAETFYTFPSAFLLLYLALRLSDQSLYETSAMFGKSRLTQFVDITLPHLRYPLLTSCVTVFTLSFSDYGAPKIVGGNYNVLATEVYQKVVGQQNFSMGAIVALFLCIPALFAFGLDVYIRRKIDNKESVSLTPFVTDRATLRDSLFSLFAYTIAACVLLLLFAVGVASFVKTWPYNMDFTFEHFTFNDYTGEGIITFWHSFVVSSVSALFGTALIFITAYCTTRLKKFQTLRKSVHLFALFPLAVPGLVIGISYLLFFAQTEWTWNGLFIPNPFHWLYGSVAIVVIANVVHFYTVPYLSAVTALRNMDGALEEAAITLQTSRLQLFRRVILPVSMPVLFEMALYLFVNSMVTISAVIFLYDASFKLASISIVNMEDAGNTASAAALSLLLFGANVCVRLFYEWTMTLNFMKKGRDKR